MHVGSGGREKSNGELRRLTAFTVAAAAAAAAARAHAGRYLLPHKSKLASILFFIINPENILFHLTGDYDKENKAVYTA